MAVRAPEVFAEYYANEIIALVSTAWLGPAYQITSQINVVNPAGAAQTAHRDYHLGFLSNEVAARYPAHRSPVVAGPDPAGCRRALRHARRERPDDVPAAPRRSTTPATSPGAGRSSARTSTPTTSRYRSRRGMLSSSTPRSSTPPGTNRSADIKRMANLIQISSAFRSRHGDRGPGAHGKRSLSGAAEAQGAGRQPAWARQCGCGLRRGLRVPDQPRPGTRRWRASPRSPSRTPFGARCARSGPGTRCARSCAPAPSDARRHRMGADHYGTISVQRLNDLQQRGETSQLPRNLRRAAPAQVASMADGYLAPLDA